MHKPKRRAPTFWKDGPNDPSVLRGELGRRFLSAFVSDFARKGRRTIEQLRRQRRQDYLRLALALLPKEFRVKEVELTEVSDAELAESLAAIRTLVKQQEKERSSIGTSLAKIDSDTPSPD